MAQSGKTGPKRKSKCYICNFHVFLNTSIKIDLVLHIYGEWFSRGSSQLGHPIKYMQYALLTNLKTFTKKFDQINSGASANLEHGNLTVEFLSNLQACLRDVIKPATNGTHINANGVPTIEQGRLLHVE